MIKKISNIFVRHALIFSAKDIGPFQNYRLFSETTGLSIDFILPKFSNLHANQYLILK